METILNWLKPALTRAAKTGAQTLAALIGTGAVGVTELDWPSMLSVTATAVVLSLLTSIAGVPESADGASLPSQVQAAKAAHLKSDGAE